MAELEFFASCLAGLEQPLAAELKSFGIERVRPLGGGAAFFCDVEHVMRACLWSRLASRIMLVVGRVNAGDADLLYAGAYNLAWEDVLAPDATMAVRAHGANDELRNSRFTALKVKDAIVDRMRSKRDERPVIDTASPRASVDVRVHDRRATISLDLSGEALNHRSYLAPADKEDAALSCSLAAGALAVGGWAKLAEAGAAFVDPVCRDGIMLVEAASMACDQAPGLNRAKWGFMGWSLFEEAVWNELVDEAYERFEAGLARVAGAEALEASRDARPDLSRVRFAGASSSSPFISKARDHVRRAGLRPAVSVELGDASSVGELTARVLKVAHRSSLAVVASNLDSKSRSDSAAHVQADEAAFVAASAVAAENAPAAGAPATDVPTAGGPAEVAVAAESAPHTGVLEDDACAAPETLSPRFIALGAVDVESRFGTAPVISAKIGRGRIETTVQVFEGTPAGAVLIEIPDMAGGAPHKVEVFEQASEQFASRLRKVFKERRKWAAREGVTCYRVYDSDLPDYAVAIDVYTGAGDARGNTYLHIAEYAPPASVDPAKARHRFNDALSIAPIVCGIRPDHVFSKTRIREKGGSQYRNAGHRAYVTTVEECGHQFEVDLAGRLDTGLFLDHRETRKLIGREAEGTRFLNLFAYTGTASVYAAAGGARTTTTVDLSQTYLDWAQRNMAANGFTGPEHSFERADVMRWITEARRSGRRFDLIFVDPPTFSNSKSMGRRTWDVQRDHVELLIGVTHLLSEEGKAVFSCNLRSFKPYIEDLEKYGVEIEDISPETIPVDFARTPRIHKCYLVRR